MITLIILALLALVVVYAVFFLLCKLAWLIFRSHSNKGPFITAGVCTVLVAVLIGSATWIGVNKVLTPFRGLMARVKQNPSPVYGQRVYKDTSFPFELTVFDGMDFSDWIHVGNIDLKVGIDTNALKKNTPQNSKKEFLMGAILRDNHADQEALNKLQQQLLAAQSQRQLSISSSGYTQVNGLPAYQAQGEGYTNRGKVNFWLTAVETAPGTLFYVGAVALENTPQLQTQALEMTHSFRLIPTAE